MSTTITDITHIERSLFARPVSYCDRICINSLTRFRLKNIDWSQISRTVKKTRLTLFECVSYRTARLHLSLLTWSSLHPELQGLLTETMDMLSLISWRRTCHTNYAQVRALLRRSLIVSLDPFFRHPGRFLRILTRYKAVIGGLTAISYVLRDPTVNSSVLEIYVSMFWYNAMVYSMSICPYNKATVARITARPSGIPFTIDRDVVSYTTFYLTNGRRIVVYRSGSVSPCSPLTRTPSTASMNFITEYSFGCAYPTLTLRRRALLSDMRLQAMTPLDRIVMNDLLKIGFSFAVCASAWPEYPVTPDNFPEPIQEDTHPCFRARHVCPFQGRFFGDSGSLVDLMDPLGLSAVALRPAGIPPFGPMSLWRLHSSFTCANFCDADDDILPDSIVSMPMMFLVDPFQSPQIHRIPRTRSRFPSVSKNGTPTRRRASSI